MTRHIATESAASLFADDQSSLLVATGRDFEYGTCSNTFTFKRALPSGLLYLDPRPTDSELGTIYPKDYEPYRFESLPPLVRLARDRVQKSKVDYIRSIIGSRAKIIDIGCGNGKLLRLMRRFGPTDWELHANDLNHEAIEGLRADRITPHSCRAEEIALDAHFDLIILNQVIEHFADVHGLLATARRLLAPGGVLLIETPSIDGLDSNLFGRSYWGGYHFPRHFYLFNEGSLIRLCEEHGFTATRASYLASPAFWVQSLHHWLLDRGYPGLARWFTLRNLPLVAAVTLFDVVRIRLGLKSSNMRLLARITEIRSAP
jgi:SAM-dependent methyltransferase